MKNNDSPPTRENKTAVKENRINALDTTRRAYMLHTFYVHDDEPVVGQSSVPYNGNA